MKKKVAGMEQQMAHKDDELEAAPVKEGRRQAVIEEDEQVQNVVLKRHSKGVKTTTLLKSALRETDLLKALDITHIEGKRLEISGCPRAL